MSVFYNKSVGSSLLTTIMIIIIILVVLAVLLADGCISHEQYANSDTRRRRGVPCYDNTIQYELEKCIRVHTLYNARLARRDEYYNIIIYRRTLTAKYYIVRTVRRRVPGMTQPQYRFMTCLLAINRDPRDSIVR